MNYLKVIGLGILIWAIMFVFISAFLNLYNEFTNFKVLTIVVSGVVSLLAAHYWVKPGKVGEALSASVLWVVVGLLLDYFVTRQFNSMIFSSTYIWGGYFMIFISPLLYLTIKEK